MTDVGGAAAGPVAALLSAIESRDLRRVADAISPDCTWQNVPHDATVGRAGVVAMLDGILAWSDKVAWDVTSAAYSDDTAWLERVDRFWIAGREHAVRCNGVFTVDRDSARVTGVHDYVDLGEWRGRIGPVLDLMRARSPVEVVERHLAAAGGGDPVAMTADYALDAVLDRGAGECHRGWFAIADHFDAVATRPGARVLRPGRPRQTAGGAVVVRWTDGHATTAAAGTDTYVVNGGRITHQRVVRDRTEGAGCLLQSP